MDFVQFNALTPGERQKKVQSSLIGAFSFLAKSARPFRATVKQIHTEKLEARSRDLLNACFPDFLGQQEVADWYARGGIAEEITSTGTHPTTSGRLRRFAGDNSLPGGRYYSVCRDNRGNDGGTLVWELMTYWNALADAFPNLVDSTVHLDSATDAGIRAAMPGLGSHSFLLLKASKINLATAEKIELGDTIAAFLPLTVRDIEIDHVIDLRLPEVQDGFAEALGEFETILGWIGSSVMVKQTPGNFLDILPTLITPRPGGNTFHQAIGVLCRLVGVSGLVFPSARRDVFVSCLRGGTVEDFDGWNFVDFRNAEIVLAERNEDMHAAVMRLFGKQIKWLREEHIGVQIDWKDDGDRRAWHVSGAEKGERNRYDIEWEIRRGARTPSPMWTPWFAGRGASG
jgi:hypothetical protein